MQLKKYNTSGKSSGSVEALDQIFSQPLNEAVLHQTVKAYLANKRQGTHSTKTRSTVSGGGKKPFKQKGTGGARQGSKRAPNQEGGAVAHGPQPRDYRQSINKKQAQLALAIALSNRVSADKLFVVGDFGVGEYSTKKIKSMLSGFKTTKTLIVDDAENDFLYKSARNIPYVECLPSMQINAENVLRYDSIIISEQSLSTLSKRLENVRLKDKEEGGE